MDFSALEERMTVVLQHRGIYEAFGWTRRWLVLGPHAHLGGITGRPGSLTKLGCALFNSACAYNERT